MRDSGRGRGHSAGEWIATGHLVTTRIAREGQSPLHGTIAVASDATSRGLDNAVLIAAAPNLLAAARAVLAWASAAGDHGGNPYCKGFVKLAELAVAKHEGRAPEAWALGAAPRVDEVAREAFADGYRDGRADALLGFTSEYARAAAAGINPHPYSVDYWKGYSQAQRDHERGEG